MTEIERIEALRKEEEFYRHLWYAQEDAVQKKLFELLNQLYNGPAKLRQPRESDSVGIDYPSFSAKENGELWEVRKIITFVDPEDKHSYDFGSTFDLYITNKSIRVNNGSCGTWGLQDVCQWSRILLIKAIFDHQEDIIREITPLIDIEVKEKLYDICREINRINDGIRKAKEEEENNSLLKTLKAAKYLAQVGRRWEYDRKPDGSIDYDSNGHTKTYWYDIYKIVKITDKSIICKECDYEGRPYEWITRHLKLSDIIYKLKRKQFYSIEDLSIAPPQDEDSR